MTKSSSGHFSIIPSAAVFDRRLSHADIRVLAALGAHAALEAAAKAEQEKKEAVALADTVIGKKLMGKTLQVDGDDYKKQDTKKVPDYYFVYYSASW